MAHASFAARLRGRGCCVRCRRSQLGSDLRRRSRRRRSQPRLCVAGSAPRGEEMMSRRPIASTAYRMNRLACAATIGTWLAAGAVGPAWANVIADWDEKAIAATAPLASVPSASTPYAAYRMMGLVHAAMFDAVNSIDRSYRRYPVQPPAEPATPQEAAATAVPGAV